MAKFWLATFQTPEPAPTTSAATPLAASGSSRFAVELIEQGDDRAVLFSSVDDLDNPQKLTCLVAFCNTTSAALVWRDRGYPILDASIEFDVPNARLSVKCACFRAGNEMDYGTDDVIAVEGVQWASSQSPAKFPATYAQAEESPDFSLPATMLVRRAITWTPYRDHVQAAGQARVTLHLEGVRSPSFLPLAHGPLYLNRVWSGDTEVEQWAPELAPLRSATRVSRADTFGLPAFRFEDVEVVGFRLDLSSLGTDWPAAVQALIAPLNFHLSDDNRRDAQHPTDFRYRAATSTVVVELLRYGKMRLSEASAPFTADDFQSQHELVVRLLVGRIDDDTAQARDPAVFVPAIFVDNPWSKVVGRDVQGFDKRMAAFCVKHEGEPRALRPNGRMPDGSGPVSLLSVSEVRLLDRMGTLDGAPLLQLGYPPDNALRDEDFVLIDANLALDTSALAPARWRQGDFDDVAFRRSFARDVASQSVRGFRSIQVAPVAEREIGKTWIQGTFTIGERIRYASPEGIASLKFFAPASAPEGWLKFCAAIGVKAGASGAFAFPTGSWYRMKFSMNLDITNPLE